MNNGPLKQTANNGSPPSASDASKRLPNPLEVISEIKQIEASVPLGAIGHHANHIDVPRIDRLIRRGDQTKD
jgi:two-component system nitrate/nitrite response regulator NarL